MKSVKTLWTLIALLLFALSVIIPQPALGEQGKSITMQVNFQCVKFQGDCGNIHVLKPPTSQAQLWLSATGVSAAKALKGETVKDGIFKLAPGELIYVKIAYVNDTDREILFRAIPHVIEPNELQNLALYNCMCLGETYRVPPRQAWFRVIRVGAAQDMPAGSRFVATHILTSEAAVWWAK